MDIILALKALIMGLVEGFTEFLPISSTGHLILAESLLGFKGMEEKMKVFEIVIQAGAIYAVCWEYRARIAGVLFNSKIKAVLFAPVPVALAFIVGALVILAVERREKKHPAMARIHSIDDIEPLRSEE